MEIGVIGAGAWGTAFSVHLARKGFSVLLWVYEADLAGVMKTTRENSPYLPGHTLPANIRFTTNIEAVCDFSGDVIVATPSFALRDTLRQAVKKLARKNLLILTKGLESETLLRMSQVTAELTGDESSIAVLSGPSFARELAQGAFTAVVVSSPNRDLAKYFQSLIHDDNFRIYTTEDTVGVELGGAMKNVMAIGAGIIEGLHLGTNTLSAFTTRALAEMKRLGKAMGAREATFMGLSGVGDLILTSYGNLSRNRQFGIALTRGVSPKEIIASQNAVVEGYYTVQAARHFSKRFGIEMPITEELYKITYEDKNVQTSINDLKHREFREEDY